MKVKLNQVNYRGWNRSRTSDPSTNYGKRVKSSSPVSKFLKDSSPDKQTVQAEPAEPAGQAADASDDHPEAGIHSSGVDTVEDAG